MSVLVHFYGIKKLLKIMEEISPHGSGSHSQRQPAAI